MQIKMKEYAQIDFEYIEYAQKEMLGEMSYLFETLPLSNKVRYGRKKYKKSLDYILKREVLHKKINKENVNKEESKLIKSIFRNDIKKIKKYAKLRSEVRFRKDSGKESKDVQKYGINDFDKFPYKQYNELNDYLLEFERPIKDIKRNENGNYMHRLPPKKDVISIYRYLRKPFYNNPRAFPEVFEYIGKYSPKMIPLFTKVLNGQLSGFIKEKLNDIDSIKKNWIETYKIEDINKFLYSYSILSVSGESHLKKEILNKIEKLIEIKNDLRESYLSRPKELRTHSSALHAKFDEMTRIKPWADN